MNWKQWLQWFWMHMTGKHLEARMFALCADPELRLDMKYFLEFKKWSKQKQQQFFREY